MDSTASLQPMLLQQQQHKLTSIQISAETTVYTSLDSSLAALQRQQQTREEDEVDGANSNSLPPAVELLLSVSAAAAVPVLEEGSEKVVLQPVESEKEERAETSRSDDDPFRSSAAVGVGAVALGLCSSSSSLLEAVQEKPSPESPPPSPVITDQESHVVRIQIVQKEDDSSSHSVVQNGTSAAVISVTNNSATIAVNGNQCKSKVSIVSFGPPEQGSQSPSPTPSVEMVQKQSSPSATPTNGKTEHLVDVNNATYLYYVMSSGQCSPSDTLDSGTCSDIEVTPPPLPKKMSPKSPSPCKHPAAQHATLMMISPTPSDKLNQPGYRNNSYTISDSDESESSLSCDSLNFSQLCGNVVVVGSPTEPTDSISPATTSPQTPEPSSTAAAASTTAASTPTSDSDRENIPECPELITAKKHKIVSILPDSLLKDIRERSSSGCAAREVPSYSPPPSPPRDETTVLTTTRSILMEKINSLNCVATMNGGSVCSLSEKNKSFSFENDKFYKFHINEHSNLQSQSTEQQQQQQQDHRGSSNGLMNLNSCSSSVIDDDESFAGFKDLTSGTSTIRSNKGTVRGVKNRVRNGIATFLQMQHANIKVPRRVIGMREASRIYLHGYSDASERAMGACVYIRATDDCGNTSSHLLCAKSKTAPIGNGRTTLPRLELCAAVILARLMANVMTAITLPFHEIRAYSDSTVALAWIYGGASRWKTFVANRVAEITTHLPAINWHHVDTHHNPADLISRGAPPDQIVNNLLWWHGPSWNGTTNTQETPPISAVDVSQQRQVEREQRSSAVAYLTVYENNFLDGMLTRYYPNLQLLLRITARILRFRHREFRTTNRLAPQEIDYAMQVYVRHVQSQHYWKEINQLEHNREINRSSSLRQLKPFLDENHLLRVGGRLHLSDFHYDTKHPILLPRHSALTALILQHEHHEQLHCGPQSLLASVRRRFWIVRGTSAARKICRACFECVRARPAPLHQLMGQLPADRLQPNPPFSITGIDYAGPINIINRRTRGAVPSKGYIALFICFSTRAVHLEAVSDLSTSAFIAAFTRFSSRYGLPSKVYSDNATNLRGAARKYRELYQQINAAERDDKVADFFTNKGIEWMFIPARSPHHGGLWEAGVKVAKAFLGKLGGDARFTFEELSTVLAQVAACMNSRPISPLSNDPNEPQPLTPAHFLIGRPLNAVPEINQLERRIGSLNRWEYVQRVAQQFRARWQSEYVLSLQRMTKWQRSAPNVSVGDFVLLVADNEKPKQWPMGRIVDTFPGSDGYVRVVAIRTVNGIVRRDVRRIRRIPLEDDEYVPGRNGAEISHRNLVGGLCCDGI